MPEEQNIWGESWNNRLNKLLSEVFLWNRLGDSNNDIWCEQLRRKVGIDSVFAYRHNVHSSQQIIIAEAKSIKKMEDVTRYKIQKWIDDFLPKLNCVPSSEEFHRLFHPENDALYHRGLIALWVRDHTTFSSENLAKILAQVSTPKSRTPVSICFLSNDTIIRLCAIHSTINLLRASPNYKSVEYYFPTYGTLTDADGKSIPIEALGSKFIFCKTVRYQQVKGQSLPNEYDGYIAFYLGEANNYTDIRFIGLALRHFQLLKSPEVEIYTISDRTNLRNHIESFKEEFKGTSCEFQFHQLDLLRTIPGWLNEDD